ncbi:MAG: hypothetical protein INQ03_02625 [Candidatus Heimdallarchaeota archaeon]|nr:hypothetical protein [Candidatus Heimdallarchaeota archaeon]
MNLLTIIILFLIFLLPSVLLGYYRQYKISKLNGDFIKYKKMVTVRIQYPSSEVLDILAVSDNFNSLIFNDRGVFLVMEEERR